MSQNFFKTYRDSSTNMFKLYATGRENIHYCHMILELKKRQHFVSILLNLLMCRSIFKSPIKTDNLWLEIPIMR